MDNVVYALGIVLAVAGGISTICGAGNWVVKLIQVMKAPNAQQDKEIYELKEWRKKADEKFDNDNRRLNQQDESNRVTQRALLALLAHGIDGNHQTQMQAAKEELENHLISK